jgi:glutamate synthase domain-containing protein 2
MHRDHQRPNGQPAAGQPAAAGQPGGATAQPLPWTGTERSYSFPPEVVGQIHEMAEVGRYEIRGWGAKRRLPTFDDLVFLTASLTRYPLEGYRELCDTTTVLGTRFASRPLELAIPITIAGMSFGALSAHAKEALGRAATAVGTSTTTGDGGMTPEERQASRLLVYQCLPSRYGFSLDDLRAADAIEVVIGQGAKPGGGGMLLGQKVSERVASMRTLPAGIDQRSASRHPDWTGPDDLKIKIEELREATGWEKPVYVKLGATRVSHDVKLAVAAGADVVVLDGMQGGTGATQTVFIEHAGIPTLPAVRLAAEALEDIGKRDEVQLIVSGGIRSGADVAKALALGADAVSIGVAALVALGCNRPWYRQGGADYDATAGYRAIGTQPGFCHHCHTGMCPVGVTTQDPELEQRLEPDTGARWMTNYLKALTMELTAIARACGKSDVHNLEPDDLAALTIEAAAMAKVPLAGTDWIPGVFRRDHMLLLGPGFAGESWHNKVHDVVSGIGYGAMVAAPLLLGWRLRVQPALAAVARPVLACGVLSAMAVAVFASRVLAPWDGLVQRLAVTLALGAQVLVAA